MAPKTRLCTCQRFCQAAPGGKAIPERTWFSHAAQRALEEEMTLEQRETQQYRRRKRPRNQRGERTHAIGGSSEYGEDGVSQNTVIPVYNVLVIPF